MFGESSAGNQVRRGITYITLLSMSSIVRKKTEEGGGEEERGKG